MTTLLNRQFREGGPRHFAAFPWTWPSNYVRDHVALLPDACVTSFLTNPAEDVVDFAWHGHGFAVHREWNEYWFFVDDPACPDDALLTVARHFERLLGPPTRP
jgi:hypothetical protein